MVTGMPTTFCATVALDPTKYNNLSPILSSAAVDWSEVTDRTLVYTANSVQTWVNGTELTVCLYVVGITTPLLLSKGAMKAMETILERQD